MEISVDISPAVIRSHYTESSHLQLQLPGNMLHKSSAHGHHLRMTIIVFCKPSRWIATGYKLSRDSTTYADVATSAGEVLQQLMEVGCIQRPGIALQLLNKLSPGLYGCTAMPRSTDTPKPQSAVLEATMNVLQNVPEAIRHLCIPIFQNALQRAPDKAPLRNQLASACGMLWKCLGASISSQVLHFLGMLTYGGEPGMRRLGLQCMEEMAISSLEQPCDDLVRLYSISAISVSNVSSDAFAFLL